MKKIFFCLTLLLLTVKSFSQTPALSKEDYLKKSKTQKTVGWVMLGGGVAMTTIGYVIINQQVNDDPLNAITTGQGYVVLMIAGAATALGSIPFFIRSAKNARRAAAISFNNQKILFPQQNTFVLKTQPTVTLKIMF